MKTLPKGHLSILSADFRYTPAAQTNLARTFARLRREQKQREAEAASTKEREIFVVPLPLRVKA